MCVWRNMNLQFNICENLDTFHLDICGKDLDLHRWYQS